MKSDVNFDTNFFFAGVYIQPAGGSQTEYAVQGENYTIEFNIVGDQPLAETANVWWVYQKNLTSVAISWPPSFESELKKQRHYLSNDTMSLSIRDVQISDKGFYTLIASSSAGKSNSTILLLVHGEN